MLGGQRLINALEKIFHVAKRFKTIDSLLKDTE